ncbi:MAG: hypothetical protein EXX96DRAFT_490495, partial [Benjaminiella poitrasii]
RKLPYDRCIRNVYHGILKSKIIPACEDVRHIVFRAQLFVNHYTPSLEIPPKHINHQNFWYTICQLIINKCVTNSTSLPEGLLDRWDAFKQRHRSIIYVRDIASGTSQCLTEACVQLSTIYTNHTVENFEAKARKYVCYRIQNIFKLMGRQKVQKVADYTYQQVCLGTPVRPESTMFTMEKKRIVDETFLSLRNIIPSQVSLKTLFASPSSFIPCLSYILSQYEAEQEAHHTYDVRRLPLPGLFPLLPNPSLH